MDVREYRRLTGQSIAWKGSGTQDLSWRCMDTYFDHGGGCFAWQDGVDAAIDLHQRFSHFHAPLRAGTFGF